MYLVLLLFMLWWFVFGVVVVGVACGWALCFLYVVCVWCLLPVVCCLLLFCVVCCFHNVLLFDLCGSLYDGVCCFCCALCCLSSFVVCGLSLMFGVVCC